MASGEWGAEEGESRVVSGEWGEDEAAVGRRFPLFPHSRLTIRHSPAHFPNAKGPKAAIPRRGAGVRGPKTAPSRSPGREEACVHGDFPLFFSRAGA